MSAEHGTGPQQGDRGPDQQVADGTAEQVESIQQSYLHQFAKFYASQGMKVFPLIPGNKTPATAHGFKDATTDLTIIDAWWFTNPQYNIGWWPGGNGYAVVDCDVKADVNGLDTLEHWFADYTGPGDIPPTLTQDTGGGGCQFVFKLPPRHEVRDSTGWKPGVDIKSAGGYVVLPPSVHPSRRLYEWRGGNQLFDLAAAVPMPSVLLEAIGGSATAPRGSTPSPITGIPTERLLDGIPDGQRNDTLFRVACRLWTKTGERGYVEWAILRAAADAAPAYPESDARKIVDRACTYPRTEVPDWTPSEDRPALEAAVDALYEVDKAKRVRQLRIDADAREEYELERRGRPDGYTLLTDTDIADRPSPQWLIPGLLPAHGVFQLYGDTGTYKSFVVQDLLRCVTTGLPWLGHYEVLRTGPVLYVAAEGGFDLSERRLAWIITHEGVVPDRFFTLDDEGVDLMLRHDVDQLIKLCAAMPQPPVMIVFDTQALHMPSGDEDKAKDLGVVIAGMKRLSRTFNALVGTVHHTGKKVENGPRGSSSGPAAWDAAMLLEKHRIVPKKVKGGAVPAPVSIRMLPVDLGVDDEGRARSSLVPQAVDMAVIDLGSEARKFSDREAQRRDIIVATVREAPGLSFTKIRNAANANLKAVSDDGKGMSPDTFKAIFDELVAAGRIEHRASKCYPGKEPE